MLQSCIGAQTHAQVWFNRIVEPKEESIRKFLDYMAAKGNPLVWGFSHDFVTRMHEVSLLRQLLKPLPFK